MKSGKLNFLEPSGPLEACNGTDLPDCCWPRDWNADAHFSAKKCSAMPFSLTTPTHAPLMYLNTVLYHCYMFRRQLRHPQGALQQHLKLTKILIRSNKLKQYAGIYLLQIYSTCFGCPSHPSSGVHKTVTAASGTDRITYRRNNLLPT